MENFLQKVTSQKHPSQSKYNQQKILQELQAMQLENVKILRTVQELERKIENPMINSKQQKIGSEQSGNIRIEELEIKFNQFAELTESIFLQKISMNDPMDVEYQTQQLIFPIEKLRDADIASDQDTKCEIVINLQERIRELEKTSGETYLESIVIKKVNATEKNIPNKQRSSLYLIGSQHLQQKMIGIRRIGRNQENKNKNNQNPQY